ncbi:ATPase domain-containing protein [Archaeoglobus neptunius]|uniref:ATPase domain-containing protein n=1 Tax=Archaeoglobus neptunius TaxID=2798580 RepID=UPI001927EF50|nr:ATPase domain-containing protein [Archaeoglobus neptunius]
MEESTRILISSGIPGFDEILGGGLVKGWSYLLKGAPGSGKTVFGLQFLREGVRNGEKVVYISFDESKEEVQMQAELFGWNINEPNFYFVDKVEKMDILTSDLMFVDFDSISEIHDIIESVVSVRELENASRVFIDGIGILRDASRDPAIYRRIMASIIRFLNSMGITSIIAEEYTGDIGKEIISYLTSGEFLLERVVRGDGEVLRAINVLKYRGGKAWLGRHYLDITDNGIIVYPIIPVTGISDGERSLISTGNKEFDSMLGGGIYEGSSVLITGKSGVGKTNMSLQILVANDRRGKTGILYTFEESEEEIRERIENIFNYKPSRLIIKPLSPYGMNLGRFYRMVVEDVENYAPAVVVIDPLNALVRMSISFEELRRAMDLLESYISSKKTISISIIEVGEAVGDFYLTGAGISYFADYMVVGRYMELHGEIQKVIAVMKNRFGDHERTLRVLEIKEGEGIRIGEPLKRYTGLMGASLEKID